MTRRTTLSAAALAGSLLLAIGMAGCAPEATAPDPTTPTASAPPSPTQTPTPTPTEAPTGASIPQSCADVGSPQTREATVDQMVLQSDGTDFVRPAPPSAQLALGCDWIQGEASGVLLLISTTDADDTDDYVSNLPSEGWDCSATEVDTPICTMSTPNAQYGFTTEETILTQDDVWIYLAASNVDGQTLLSDLRTQIFSD